MINAFTKCPLVTTYKKSIENLKSSCTLYNKTIINFVLIKSRKKKSNKLFTELNNKKERQNIIQKRRKRNKSNLKKKS